MTNGGINNVGALRLSMSQNAALTSIRLTDAQVDAIMRCSTLELAATGAGGVLGSVAIFYPLTAYVPTDTIRDFFTVSAIGTAEAPATLFYTIRYDKTTNGFTSITQII